MLETAIALKRHRQHQGGYPEDLESVAKDLPAETITDPSTGRPFEYTLKEAGFILKSPGPKAVGGDKNSGIRYPDIIWQAKN
jgi:hypothetical protein